MTIGGAGRCLQLNEGELLDRVKQLHKLRDDLDQLLRDTEPARRMKDTPPEVPGFRIGRPLGSGGMGTVFLAEQQTPKRTCALKLINNTLPAAVGRFRREADLAARLSHTGLAQHPQWYPEDET